MIWLVQEIWPFLLLAAGLGALLVTVLAVRVTVVVDWVDVPVVAAQPGGGAATGSATASGLTGAGAAEADARVRQIGGTAVALGSAESPFPALRGPQTSSWEEEELWSRPARLAPAPAKAAQNDEWSEAADSWRSWADEAGGRPGRQDGRQDGRQGAAPPTGAFDDGPEDAFPYARPVEAPFADDEDDFPFARPVDAADVAAHSPPPGFADPGSLPTLSDDDLAEEGLDEEEAAEIAEIRRAAQARRLAREQEREEEGADPMELLRRMVAEGPRG